MSDLSLLKKRRSSLDFWGTNHILPGFAPGKSSQAVDEDELDVESSTAEWPIGPTKTVIPPNNTFSPLPFPTIGPDANTSEITFDYTKQVKYKSYHLDGDRTFVELAKEPRAGWTGTWEIDPLEWSLNLDAVIETAYRSWPPQTPLEQEPPCGFHNEPKKSANIILLPQHA